MKIKINNKEQNTEIKFPCLMISKDNGIVLMTEPEKGTVLNNFPNPIGYYSEEWYMPNFKPFNGSITLSNE